MREARSKQLIRTYLNGSYSLKRNFAFSCCLVQSQLVPQFVFTDRLGVVDFVAAAHAVKSAMISSAIITLDILKIVGDLTHSCRGWVPLTERGTGLLLNPPLIEAVSKSISGRR